MLRLLLIMLLLVTNSVVAHEYKNDEVNVDHPWARPTFALATTGAVYLSLENLTDAPKTLVKASVDSSVAAKAELHDVLMDGDVMKMREQTMGVGIPAGGTVAFAPGGKHIMLLGLNGPLTEGKEFNLTLHFEDKSAIDVVVYVENPQSSNDEPAHQH